jgi:hypothetical protein
LIRSRIAPVNEGGSRWVRHDLTEVVPEIVENRIVPAFVDDDRLPGGTYPTDPALPEILSILGPITTLAWRA